MVLGRVLKALMSYSADMTPETAAQRSFRTLRDNSEVKEMLFNKSLYQRGKSVRIYILFSDSGDRIQYLPVNSTTQNLHQFLLIINIKCIRKYEYIVFWPKCPILWTTTEK